MKAPAESLAFTAAGAAQACGLPRTTIDSAIANGQLPATRSGRRFIVLREDLTEWLRTCRTKGEIPARAPSDVDKERLAELNRKRVEEAARRREEAAQRKATA